MCSRRGLLREENSEKCVRRTFDRNVMFGNFIMDFAPGTLLNFEGIIIQ